MLDGFGDLDYWTNLTVATGTIDAQLKKDVPFLRDHLREILAAGYKVEYVLELYSMGLLKDVLGSQFET